MNRLEAKTAYRDAMRISGNAGQLKDTMRYLARNDLFFLLVCVLKRKDADNDFVFARCREVSAEPNGCLDLWSREHYKSTIITFALTIQDILNDPEVTVGIFSFNRPIAKQFLRQIKTEFEQNDELKYLFDEILFADPKKESPKWSEDDGITVKRKENPKECTVEAWGLIDGQPTALDISTPILTIDGWKPHGELEVGDYVYDANGKPVMVIHNTGPMLDKPCTKVVFDDTEIVAANDHLWPVDRVISPRNMNTGKQDSGWTYTIREIVKTSELPLSCGPKRDKRRRMMTTPLVQYPGSPVLPIDPYVLGQWLGDGSSDCGIITTGDYEILEYFTKAGYTIKVAQDRGNYKMFRLVELRPQLKEMELLWNKHIPVEYLHSSIEDRLALFQGLMDSDGSCRLDGWGQSVFTNCNKTLIDQVHELAVSLGIKPARIKSYHDGHGKHSIRYTFSFTGTKDMPPFRLARKLSRCLDQKTKAGRYVRVLKPTITRPVNCIQVLSEDGLYLAGKCLVPTHNSKHFKGRVYDDVVTRESVTTTEMIQKVTNAWELSINLGSAAGEWERYAGTIYHYADTYRVMRDRGVVKVRIHTPTVDGTLEGEPVLWTREVLAKKVKKMGIYTASCQLFMDPKQDNAQGFKQEWLRYWDADRISSMNVYILCDPACEKKDSSDYTVFVVIGLGYDQNYYVIDIIRDRLSLTEKANVLFSLHMKYRPKNVGYEKYGMQSDIQYFQDKMSRENYRFPITPLGGSMPKNDRIKRLVPYFQAGRVYLPSSTPHRIYSGDTVDTAKQFILDEYLAFPFSSHDDQMDALARILDPELSAVFPQGNPVDPYELEKASSGTYDPKRY